MNGRPRGVFFAPIGSSSIAFWIYCFRLGLGNDIPLWIVDARAKALFSRVILWEKLGKYYLIAFFPYWLLLWFFELL